jgi:hypothetical protein
VLVASLAGCGTLWPWGNKTPEPVTVVNKPADKTPLNLPTPDALRLKPIQWIVVTPQNAEQVFQQLEARGQDPVLFAITDDGYMSLAQSMAEIRNFMNTQRTIIIEYKKYYETPAREKP